MTAEQVKQIIINNKNEIAFVIGNGINLYKPSSENTSWENLLKELWDDTNQDYTLKEILNGLSFIELYDIIVLNSGKSDKQIQNLIVEKMRTMAPSAHHNHIVKAIKDLNAPILTTNYDKNLSDGFSMQK